VLPEPPGRLKVVREVIKKIATLWRDEILKKIFWVVIALISAGLVFVVHTYVDHLDTASRILLAIAILIAASWGINYFYRRFSYRHCYYPNVKFSYVVLEKRITYCIEQDGLLYFKRYVKLKSKMDNLEAYIDKFVWTGGISPLPDPSFGIASTEHVLKAGIWTFYRSVFPQTIKKGQEYEFEVRWPALGNWRDSSPFASGSIDEPTKKLSFSIEIPSEHVDEPHAYLEELRGIESAYPFSTQKVSFNHGAIDWELKPKLYRHYRVRWTWKGSELEDMAKIADETSAE